MINVEAEVSRYKNCKNRDELGMAIQEYKKLALKFANDIVLAGKYNSVALKLQDIQDKLPAPRMKNLPATHKVSVKTANITNEEKKRIDADWKRKAKQ